MSRSNTGWLSTATAVVAFLAVAAAASVGAAASYDVNSPVNEPFHGIAFVWQSGSEIVAGGFDDFRITLPQGVVTGMRTVPVAADAGPGFGGQGTIEACRFDQGAACEPVFDDNGIYTFAFINAVDNGDGTTTLTFRILNRTSHPLRQVTIGLPAGVVPSAPTGSYDSGL